MARDGKEEWVSVTADAQNKLSFLHQFWVSPECFCVFYRHSDGKIDMTVINTQGTLIYDTMSVLNPLLQQPGQAF